MNKKQKMYAEIETHGKNLLVIFPNAKEQNPVKLSKKLRSLEVKANRIATDWCNGDITNEQFDALAEPIREKLNKLLNPSKDAPVIWFNGDARGCTLKLKEGDYRLFKDWGSYGILAPDFSL
jgi:hypothetical protein